MKIYQRILLSAAAILTIAVAAISGVSQSAGGSGALLGGTDDNGRTFRRHFSFNAHTAADGTVFGKAVLINPEFDGAQGNQPYQLHIDISCMNVIDDVVFFGGTTRRTTDPNLTDAVYFSVQDNGEPGAGSDQISRAFFFDGDPATTGDPALCLGATLTDLPLETIVSGNLNVH